MSTAYDNPAGHGGGGGIQMTANDRFKRRFGDFFWGSLIVATLGHFALFLFFPQMTAADWGGDEREMESYEIPDEVEIPPPPEQIARPATPVVAEANIDEDITIAETTFEDNPVENLPPPPTGDNDELGRFQQFVPTMTQPRITNGAEVERVLQNNYPPLLRDAGVGGQVVVWFWIDENGRVVNHRIQQSSGHTSMDDAALTVADVMEFRPAMNRDRAVPVVVAIPITFQVN